MACFEPSLDYVVVKIPRWDLQKFRNVSKNIGTEMKSVGEVMAIGRTFEEAMQKAIRMLQIGMYGLVGNKIYFKALTKSLKYPTDQRIFAVINSLERGDSIERIYKLTKIDKWLLYKLKNVVETRAELKKYSISKVPKDLLYAAKKQGYSDKQVAMLLGEKNELTIRELRKKLEIIPVVKQIDTLAAEYPAKTNYLYLTYNGIEDDVDFKSKKQVIVLGSGAYRIGSSVEFDWCCVSAVRQLGQLGFETIMVNYNPETVSTDYDICDKLYFDELSFETVIDIYEKEKPLGLIVSTGGQIPNNLALKCHDYGLKILGTSAENIDIAENRHKFSKLCDELSIDQPEWKELTTEKDALSFAKKAGFPVLVRPSYVLSGQAMKVAFNEPDLKAYLKEATSLSKEYPVVMSKFILNAHETEIDAVAENGNILCWAATEHVENAGVHSGDATMVMPPQRTYIETIRKMKDIASKIATELKITGPFNIQFISKDNEVKVIECNLRASRSFPFVSKVLGTDFIKTATSAIMGKKTGKFVASPLDLDHVGVKAPQFSFSRLRGADPISGVEMASTGEVGCIGTDLHDAFLKALLSTGMKIPKKTILLAVSGDENRYKLLDNIAELSRQGFRFYGTEHTALFFQENNIDCTMVHKMHEKKTPNVSELITEKKLDLVISIPNPLKQIDLDLNYDLRRTAVDHSIPLITNLQVAKLFTESITKKKFDDLEIKAWDEYI
jgi:carbamoyl-phosphate synthase large subunit